MSTSGPSGPLVKCYGSDKTQTLGDACPAQSIFLQENYNILTKAKFRYLHRFFCNFGRSPRAFQIGKISVVNP